MGGVVAVQYPSDPLSMSILGPLQKLSFTLAASGALNRICTRELLSTFGYCASSTFDDEGLKSPCSCAKQRLAANTTPIAINLIAFLRPRQASSAQPISNRNGPRLVGHWHGNPRR